MPRGASKRLNHTAKETTIRNTGDLPAQEFQYNIYRPFHVYARGLNETFCSFSNCTGAQLLVIRSNCLPAVYHVKVSANGTCVFGQMPDFPSQLLRRSEKGPPSRAAGQHCDSVRKNQLQTLGAAEPVVSSPCCRLKTEYVIWAPLDCENLSDALNGFKVSKMVWRNVCDAACSLEVD